MSEQTTHISHSESAVSPVNSEDAINLLDLFEVIAKRWPMIFKVTTVVCILSVIVSFLLPKIYQSTARIIPPQQDGGMLGMMTALAGNMGGFAGDILGKGTTADLYVGMLKTEAVKDAIIDRFKMLEVDELQYRADAYNILDKKVDIAVGKKDGIVSIRVEDKDPKRATDMANAYVEELEKLTLRLNITDARKSRSFLQERLGKANADLARAEDNLKAFQASHKLLDLPEQAKESIKGIAQLRAQLATQEVQLAALRQQYTDSSNEIKTLKASINNVRAQIHQLESAGTGGAIPNIGAVPELGKEYLRLVREFKIQETIVELLSKQFEMSKLSEAHDVGTMQILQKAGVPDKKSKPKRKLIVLLSTFAGGFGAVLFALILEALERMPKEDREQLGRIRSMFPSISLFRRRCPSSKPEI